MNYAPLFFITIIQFVSQTFLIKFNPDNFNIRRVGGITQIGTSPNLTSVYVPNFYNLPVVVKRFEFYSPPVKMKVKNYSYSKFVKNIDLKKSAEPVPFSIKNPLNYKYRGKGITIKYPAYLSDVRETNGKYVASVIVFPYKYNEQEKELFKLDSCTLQFEFKAKNTNTRKIGNSPLYLIVSPDSILHGFDSLALWKKQKGYRVKLLSMEEVITAYTGHDDAEKLRNALKEYYNDSGLVYVLLGGDADKVPARVAYAMTCGAGFVSDEDSIRADLYYSDLDGTWDFDGDGTYGEVEDSVDLYPDVYVGRVPVDNIEQARMFSQKLIDYEQNPTERARNALFFAMILWNDDPYPYTNSGESKDYIDSVFIPEYYNVTKLYEANGTETYTSVMSALNEGQGILNHNGHGWWTGMWLNGSPSWEHLSNEDADTLKMAFGGVLYSIGCWVGAFDREDAISEHFVLNPDGPVAVIANSRYGWGSPGNPLFGYSDKFDQNFYRKIFDDSIFHVGITLAEDKADYVPFSHWENVFRWHQYQVNLFGDPEMELHTGYEGRISSDFPSEISPKSAVYFTVYDSIGRTISHAKASISYGDSVFAVCTTDFAGNGVLNIPQNVPDSLLLIVYARNHTTLKKWIHTSRAVYAEKMTVNGTDSTEYFFPGDTGTIEIDLKNGAYQTVSNFYVKLYGSGLLINPDSFFVTDTIAPDSSLRISTKYTVFPSLRKGDSVKVGVETPWGTRVFTKCINKPHVILKPVSPADLNVGSDNLFGFTIYNAFSFDIHSVIVYIKSSMGIIPYQDSFSIGSVAVHDSTYFSFNAYVADSSAYIEFIVKNNAFLEDTASISYGVNPGEYYCDFEAPLWDFYITGNWKRTSARSHSGTYSVWSGNNGHYENNAHDTLITPWVKTGASPVLSFYMWYDASVYGVDGVHVYYYANNTWNELDYIGSGGALDTRGIVVGWSEYSYPLDGLGFGDSTRIMFVLMTDDTVTSEGFYIDDIRLSSVSYSLKNETVPGELYYISMPTLISGKTLTLTYNLEETPHVFLYDIEGRQINSYVLTGKRGRVSFDIEKLRNGVYFVLVSHGKEKNVKKVVVQR